MWNPGLAEENMLRFDVEAWSMVCPGMPVELEALVLLSSLSFLLKDGGGRGGGVAANDEEKKACVFEDVGGEEERASACILAGRTVENDEEEVERVEADDEGKQLGVVGGDKESRELTITSS